METRNVSITLEKAKEWYNSGNSSLQEVALQAFQEYELKEKDFRDIKTFEDAVNALGFIMTSVQTIIDDISKLPVNKERINHLIAIYKLDIIRKALNGDWKPSLINGTVYYPWIRFFPHDSTAKDNQITFRIDGEEYALIGSTYLKCTYGMGDFSNNLGDIVPSLGLFSCKSEEIARHMSKHFSKEVFEAVYAQHLNYEWV